MTEAKLTSAKKLMAEKAKAKPPAKPAVKTKAKAAAKKTAAKPKAVAKAPKPTAAAKEKPAVNSASSMLKDFYSSLNNAANTARAA